VQDMFKKVLVKTLQSKEMWWSLLELEQT
jgi:hypothetical protein